MKREPLLTRQQLAAYLGISLRTLDRYRRDDSLRFPGHISVPGGPRWHVDLVDKWVAQRPSNWKAIATAKTCEQSPCPAPLEAQLSNDQQGDTK